ncbi:uncharacterized protein BXZ73DRAFT_91935 [Epithele typhae]|uniref:uncharacterized protein n=1 Tax=Epithele typhae TaxID=378194 RepID=UPI0020087652|nr:uncharacterized protein BXZ73DRAFT_91935 [Epithele typhae]KAH9920194.1 hypothetical protein BXZ73DRAFT_91935 [Epithele typhae]
MAAALSQLSACVTRILSLTGFPKELKTRDIQAAFSEWDTVSGGFKIKWINDTSLLIVFNDATVAKRAYLHALAFPPSIFTSPNTSTTATIKPYDGPDAQEVIQSVNSRTHNNARGHAARASVSHARGVSVSHSYNRTANNSGAASTTIQTNGLLDQTGAPVSARDRDQPSPTLPSLPSHPTLNALISSSLSTDVSPIDPTAADPAVLAAQPEHGAPRIGDPGKRMLGAALGVRHPGLGPRVINGAANPEVQRPMAGMVGSE